MQPFQDLLQTLLLLESDRSLTLCLEYHQEDLSTSHYKYFRNFLYDNDIYTSYFCIHDHNSVVTSALDPSVVGRMIYSFLSSASAVPSTFYSRGEGGATTIG